MQDLEHAACKLQRVKRGQRARVLIKQQKAAQKLQRVLRQRAEQRRCES